MDKALTHADWSLIQSFLAVAETGSLSAAARQLERSQPTLGRQIQTLEAELEVSLFERHARGLKLSDVGHQLLPMAQQMHTAMNAFSMTAAGQSQQLDGTVRITASVFASNHILPPILAHIRQQEPAIQLELVATDATENLLFREADIAVRMYRPEQMDILTRHLGEISLCFCAAKSYLDRAGRPTSPEEVFQHDLVGFDADDRIIASMQERGWNVGRDAFATRCDHQTVYWELIRAGCGLGFSQIQVAEADPLVEILDIGVEIKKMPVWLAAPQAMRQTPRIRRVWDLLAEGLKASL
ncbi:MULTISPECIES: LysR family transcriptional regulator [unclassified Ruegeria]|uniref:LysR family transcriptional regulator n=1 Tax=unclassified Ruegeria TaxID=2625375 RepID=UPI001487A6F3|nr:MULTISPECIES: LysR family transcriptional regulator [unclassified Ruegeria]NOD78270.1 LysR family transcriptional regulator [Ruegeria sp. HKCCD4332]NOD90610.1 LysR family transcriptional regulator [Ruegeria sp. HKCCD4318]NOE15887.1 LysR family transcriptional regulator [Ruegeria sp. HKCCD4318-2]NOG10779.1 LysR family transcriptional regulator [Ruegeria sp. HKCCD4315]